MKRFFFFTFFGSYGLIEIIKVFLTKKIVEKIYCGNGGFDLAWDLRKTALNITTLGRFWPFRRTYKSVKRCK